MSMLWRTVVLLIFAVSVCVLMALSMSAMQYTTVRRGP